MEAIAARRSGERRVRHQGAARRALRAARVLGLAVIASVVALAIGVAGAGAQSAGGGCAATNGNCVMLIQVSGLEPKDVTPEGTPFLWALAHPNTSNNAGAAPYTTLLSERNGFAWQAARTTVTAGTAPAAASLLTGGDPKEHGIPSDEFITHVGNSDDHLRLALDGGTPEIFPISSNDFPEGVQNMHSMVDDQIGETTAKTAAYLGDPGLADLVAGEADAGLTWHPTPGETPGNPSYCAPPRNPFPSGPDDPTGGGGTCKASDGQVIDAARTGLTSAQAENVVFTYLQLAELGAVKERSADVDNDPDVQSTLQQTDSLLSGLFFSYQQAQPDKFGATTIFVVGDHGYESTPVANRVPSGDTSDTGADLEDFIEGEDRPWASKNVNLMPQGSMATIYCESCTAAERPTVLKQIKDAIDNDVNDACTSATDPDGCVEPVLYVRQADAPAEDADQTVPVKHPGWNLDHITLNPDTGASLGPSRTSGDLVVLAREGWATGKVTPTVGDLNDTTGDIVTNAFESSSGGPRNRAIAALVSAPQRTGSGSLRQVASDRYPVTNAAVGGTETNPVCPENPSGTPKTLTAANSNPVDDANADPNLCQAEIRDFLPTMAALMQIGVPPDQLSGRLLNEAFPGLASTCRFDCPEPLELPDTFLTNGPICGRDDHGTPDPEDDSCFPQGDDGRIPGKAQTTEPVSTFEFVGFPEEQLGGFECSLDGAGFTPCSSPYTTPAFEPGTEHEFRVRAFNPTGPDPTPAIVVWEIIELFKCDKPICSLSATATKGRKLKLTGAFGNPHSLLTMSFYQRVKKKKGGGKGQGGKDRAAPNNCDSQLAGDLVDIVDPKQTMRAASKRCRVKTLATFDPISIERGPLEASLKIPKHFSRKKAPTHLGIFLVEARKLPISDAKIEKCKNPPGKGNGGGNGNGGNGNGGNGNGGNGKTLKRAKPGKDIPDALCAFEELEGGHNAAGIIAIENAKLLK